MGISSPLLSGKFSVSISQCIDARGLVCLWIIISPGDSLLPVRLFVDLLPVRHQSICLNLWHDCLCQSGYADSIYRWSLIACCMRAPPWSMRTPSSQSGTCNQGTSGYTIGISQFPIGRWNVPCLFESQEKKLQWNFNPGTSTID